MGRYTFLSYNIYILKIFKIKKNFRYYSYLVNILLNLNHKNILIAKPIVNPATHLSGLFPGNNGVIKYGTIKNVINEYNIIADKE